MSQFLQILKLQERFTLELDVPAQDYLDAIRRKTISSEFHIFSYMADFKNLFDQSRMEFKGRVNQDGFRLRSKPRSWINSEKRYFGFRGIHAVTEAVGTQTDKSSVEIQLTGLSSFLVLQFCMSFLFLMFFAFTTSLFLITSLFFIGFTGILYFHARRSMKILRVQLEDECRSSTVNWEMEAVL